LKKYSKGKLKMGRLIYEGPMTAWVQICIGVAILLLAGAPFLLALGKLLQWIR